MTRKSISSIIDDAVKYYVDSKPEMAVYKRLASLPYVDDEEQAEIEEELKSLTEEDLEIDKVEVIETDEGKDHMDEESSESLGKA